MHLKRFEYDPASRQITRKVDIDGQAADYDYDGLQRLGKVTARNGRVVESYAYTYLDNLASYFSGLGIPVTVRN